MMMMMMMVCVGPPRVGWDRGEGPRTLGSRPGWGSLLYKRRRRRPSLHKLTVTYKRVIPSPTISIVSQVSKMMLVPLLVVALATIASAAISEVRPHSNRPGRFLSLPVPQKCANRPKEFNFRGHNYFFSGHVPAHANQKVDWLDARNICREYCMDLISLETQEENNMIFRLIQQNDVPYIWTSGRLCDFKGCENRRDLEPKSIYGWFWSANREKMAPTNQLPSGWGFNPWSQTGHKKTRQPDNAEFDINGTHESCLSVLNNVYNDGIAWHDVACYHEKPFVCEDSEELLSYVASTNRGIRL